MVKPTELLTRAQREDALRAFTELTTLDRTDVAAHNGKGDCLRVLEDDTGAFDCYIATLDIDESNLHALHGCAVVRKSQTRLQDSIHYLERALRVDAGFTDARLLLATVHTDLGTRLRSDGQDEAGLASYVKAVEVDPTYAPAHYNLGVVYGESPAHYNKALDSYQRAVQYRLPEGYCEAHCNMGVIQKNLGMLEEAVASYERSLAANRNFAMARGNLAVALTDLGTAVKVNKGDHKGARKLYVNKASLASLFALN